ncbi:DUF6093 family protein [Microbacterium sp. KNMS]
MIGFTPDILTRGRELARTKMRATVVIRREGDPVRSEETGELEPTWTVIYPAGPAELRIGDNDPRNGDSVGERFSVQGPVVALPVDGAEAAASAAVEFDDVGEVLADPDNPANVGLRFRVDGQHVKSLGTARRLPVEVLSFA